MKRTLAILAICIATTCMSTVAMAAKLIKPATAGRLIRADVKGQFPAVKRWSVQLDKGSLQGHKWFTAREIMPKSSLLTVMPAEVRGIINMNKSARGVRIAYPKRTFR